jgi:hypothetical protein
VTDPDTTHVPTRRTFLRTSAGAAAVGVAGCRTAPGEGNGDGNGGGNGDDPLLAEGFESGLDGWTTHSHIGPEEPQSGFEWEIDRSETEAAAGDWSLEVFTEGDHDDGTAWVTTELSVPDGASSFSASLSAWSESESFNVLRNLVAYLGPEEPTEEGDFPDPGMNSSAVPDAPAGGLREPLHLTEGWREYTFEWEPESVPDTLYFAAGVTVIWEADATHYLDEFEVVVE